MEGSQQRVVEHGHVGETMDHGVQISGFTIGEFFYRHQLSVKHFSETACGNTEKVVMSKYITDR